MLILCYVRLSTRCQQGIGCEFVSSATTERIPCTEISGILHNSSSICEVRVICAQPSCQSEARHPMQAVKEEFYADVCISIQGMGPSRGCLGQLMEPEGDE
jgi:hypothetical protein